MKNLTVKYYDSKSSRVTVTKNEIRLKLSKLDKDNEDKFIEFCKLIDKSIINFSVTLRCYLIFDKCMRVGSIICGKNQYELIIRSL